MGNNKSNLNQADQLPIHPGLINLHVFQGKQEKLMAIQLTQHQTDFESQKNDKINYKQMIKSGRHLFWPKQTKFRTMGLCSQAGFSTVIFPYCPVTLKDEIMHRSQSNVRFQQKQLWYLLYSLIELAEQVHHYNQTLGDIQPLNSLFSQKGQIKVLTKYSLPSKIHHFDKAIKPTSHTFLSPQQSYRLTNNQQSNLREDPSSECFSIGLTVLAASLLRTGEEIYQRPKTFQKNILEQYIAQLQKQTKYQEDFKFIVKGLCQQKPSKRFQSLEVFKCLQMYESSIYNLQTFHIKSFPGSMTKKQSKIKQQALLQLDSNQQFFLQKQKGRGLFTIGEHQQEKERSFETMKSFQDKAHYLSKRQILQNKNQEVPQQVVPRTKFKVHDKVFHPNQDQDSPYKELNIYQTPIKFESDSRISHRSTDLATGKKDIHSQFQFWSPSFKPDDIELWISNDSYLPMRQKAFNQLEQGQDNLYEQPFDLLAGVKENQERLFKSPKKVNPEINPLGFQSEHNKSSEKFQKQLNTNSQFEQFNLNKQENYSESNYKNPFQKVSKSQEESAQEMILNKNQLQIKNKGQTLNLRY